jgi:hypothetical protein
LKKHLKQQGNQWNAVNKKRRVAEQKDAPTDGNAAVDPAAVDAAAITVNENGGAAAAGTSAAESGDAAQDPAGSAASSSDSSSDSDSDSSSSNSSADGENALVDALPDAEAAHSANGTAPEPEL